MDDKTVDIYNRVAAQWVQKYRHLRSKLLQRLAVRYFHPSEETLEIGCGSGRDLGLLNNRGFPTVGLDASEGLLGECRKHSPHYEYILDSLPLLEKVKSQRFSNIYSSAVIMHLKDNDIPVALDNILRVMRENGVFVFSYRHSLSDNEREPDGRLFTFIDPDDLKQTLQKKGFCLLFYESEEGVEQPKLWHHFAVRKVLDAEVATGQT